MSVTNTRPRVRGSTFTQTYQLPRGVSFAATSGRRPACEKLGVAATGSNRHSQNADRTRNCVYMITGTTVDRRNDHREGILAKAIEEQTAKLPSDTFLWAAGGSIAASLTLKLIGRDKDALFVGQWAPTFLILGLYNKLVKQLGSDRTENQL
jgi:hypothetical protein